VSTNVRGISGPATSAGTSPADENGSETGTQLELQRRILEVLADREDELRRLRREQGADPSDAIVETGRPESRRRIRERWLEAREELVRLKERIESLEARGGGAPVPSIAIGDPDRPFAACTIVCRNYLAQARTLMASLAEHEPTVRRYLLVLDAEPDEVDAEPGVTVIAPSALRIPDFVGMSFKYGVVEFNTAVKPFLLSFLLDEIGEQEVVYFDPDIVVERRLDELRAALSEASIVLTPHLTEPIPDDGLTPTEPDIMVSGAYNLGFIGIRGTPEARRFLGWWESRLEDGCRIDVPSGLFTDQKWIDLVPGLFPDTRILRDQAYNVAFWNLHERRVDGEPGDFLVNGRPAAFFHISGFDPLRPDLVSKHQTRTKVEPGTGLEALLWEYARRLEAAGWSSARDEEYGYARFADGVAIPPQLRRLYLGLSPDERRRFGDPFRDLGPGGFRDWATRPRPECGGSSYFMLEIYRDRADLQEAFPAIRGRDRASFHDWVRTQGPLEMGYDPALIPASADEAESLDTSGPRWEPAEPSFEASTASNGFPIRSSEPEPSGLDPVTYDGLVDRIREVAVSRIPPGSTVLIVSRGDYRLGHLRDREAWHFPRAENGLYAGYHPRTSSDALEHLEEQRALGAEYLLFPATSLWWLDFYADFRADLDRRFSVVFDDPEVCRIYRLEVCP
jgi:hypothetical protein